MFIWDVAYLEQDTKASRPTPQLRTVCLCSIAAEPSFCFIHIPVAPAATSTRNRHFIFRDKLRAGPSLFHSCFTLPLARA